MCHPINFALIYTGLGDKDQAFAWLQKAYEDRSAYPICFKVEPMCDSLRSDPRFTDLLRRMRLSSPSKIWSRLLVPILSAGY